MGIFSRKRRWRVHLCTITPDQQPYYDAVARWLRQQGHRVLVEQSASLTDKLAAARACDLCVLLLGPTYGPREPQLSFSATELEAYAALEGQANKLLTFAQTDAETASAFEQQEFIARLRDFSGGSFQATADSPEQFVAQVCAALDQVQAAAERMAKLNLSRAIMLSSTGDLVAERTCLRALFTKERHPVIDYQTAASETTTPIQRVTSWAGQCRALVLVLGQRYGFVSPVDGLGVTELEFVTALGAGRPILALLRPDALSTADLDQQQFVARVRHLLPAERVRPCPTLADLEHEARDGLRRILASTPPSLPAITSEQAQKWYQRHVRRWLGRLPHTRNPTGMPLTTMPLLLVEKPIDIETLLNTTDSGWTHFMPETLSGVATTTPEDALALTPHLIVAGPPGAGKSAILHWYALTAEPGQVPVLVSLVDYARARSAGQVVSLLDYVEREERRLLLAAPSDPSRWRAALQAGQGMLLLDDWDALTPAEQGSVAQDIQACAAQVPPAARIVAAQRTGPATPWPGFTPMYILPLLQGQQQEIITQWMAAEHQHEGLSEEQVRERVVSILFQMRSLSSLTSWARTPRLLTALITVIDGMETRSAGIFAGSGAVLLRRVLRLLLTLDVHPHALYEKERLLVAVARLTLTEPPQKILPTTALQAGWQEVAATSGTTLEAVLRDLNRNALLMKQQDEWAYIHPIFPAFYAASVLAAQPADRRNKQIARHRLFDAWEVPLLLPGELDRLGRSSEADAVIGALFHGDTAPIAGSGYPDPFHYALYVAATAQGARLATYAEQGYGSEMARRLMQLLHESQDQGHMLHQIMWVLSLMGPAAATVMDDVIALYDAPNSLAWLVLRQLAQGGNTRAQEVVADYNAKNPPSSFAWSRLDTSLEETLAALQSAEPQKRWQVAAAISKFGPRAAPAVPALVALLVDADSMVRQYAAQALAAIGMAALPALPDLLNLALHDPDYSVNYEARQALTRLKHTATAFLPTIAPQLRSDDDKERKRAAETLGALGEVATPLAPDLIALALYDADDSNRFSAGRAITQLGPAAVAEANAAIATAIQGDDAKSKRIVLQLAATLGPLAAPLIDLLRACVRDPAFPERFSAITAIGNLKTAGAPALPELRALLMQKELRNSVLSAINDMGPTSQPLQDGVLALQDDPDRSIRAAVYSALRGMRVEVTPRIEAVLLHGMQDDQRFVRESAYFAAATLRPVTPADAAEMVRRFYTAADEEEVRDLRLKLGDVLPALWDAGPLT